MKKIICALAGAALIALVAAAGFFAWLMHDMHEIGKTDHWNTDLLPDAAMKANFAKWGLPDSITRELRAGSSSRINGDGRKLTIYCFPPDALSNMKSALGQDSTWADGLPAGTAWKAQIEELAPKDFSPGDFSDSSAFVHLPSAPDSLGWTIIDVRRGVSYLVIIRT